MEQYDENPLDKVSLHCRSHPVYVHYYASDKSGSGLKRI
jgi:hypothetical protein